MEDLKFMQGSGKNKGILRKLSQEIFSAFSNKISIYLIILSYIFLFKIVKYIIRVSLIYKLNKLKQITLQLDFI